MTFLVGNNRLANTAYAQPTCRLIELGSQNQPSPNEEDMPITNTYISMYASFSSPSYAFPSSDYFHFHFVEAHDLPQLPCGHVVLGIFRVLRFPRGVFFHPLYEGFSDPVL